ncbi:MAG: [FeFe] hydrogenase H-cluster radical SAM maturase HydG [Candidatus Izimaplasma sp.]|nr:[FeFe] hydrogenase H-cluster radical SAM maturase HydG [Candidatus Izimaplasma bacterium]
MIDKNYIYKVINNAKNPSLEDVDQVIEKARKRIKLTHHEIAILLNAKDKQHLDMIYDVAGELKQEIYGERVVIFAPLYISNYCINNCKYCGYRRDNKFHRKKLTFEEIKGQAKLLEQLGHKRLALEVGEHPKETPIDYVVKAIQTIYDHSSIRRINVNIAATTVAEYKKLKDVGIGTYILFQETYDRDAFFYQHPSSVKGDYDYHFHAFDRAFEAGIDDVGAGVLFGLADWKFEVMALIMHNEYLEDKYGVGFHTISVPRLKKAEGMSLEDYPHMVSDEEFKRLVTILRLSVPYVGMILSTREPISMRSELIDHGISQVSAGSKTDVGGYHDEFHEHEPNQFELADERSVLEVNKALINKGHIPSYCTACYRNGRTGDRFMRLAKSGKIGLICEPNALMTLTEYVLDYGDPELIHSGIQFIKDHAENIKDTKVKEKLNTNIARIIAGERDLFF